MTAAEARRWVQQLAEAMDAAGWLRGDAGTAVGVRLVTLDKHAGLVVSGGGPLSAWQVADLIAAVEAAIEAADRWTPPETEQSRRNKRRAKRLTPA